MGGDNKAYKKRNISYKTSKFTYGQYKTEQDCTIDTEGAQ